MYKCVESIYQLNNNIIIQFMNIDDNNSNNTLPPHTVNEIEFRETLLGNDTLSYTYQEIRYEYINEIEFRARLLGIDINRHVLETAFPEFTENMKNLYIAWGVGIVLAYFIKANIEININDIRSISTIIEDINININPIEGGHITPEEVEEITESFTNDIIAMGTKYIATNVIITQLNMYFKQQIQNNIMSNSLTEMLDSMHIN